MFTVIALRLLETYFRHRWLYLLPIVLAAILAVANVYTTKPKYMSQGVLYVQADTLLASLVNVDPANRSWLTPAQRTRNELEQLLKTNAFIRAIVGGTDLEGELGGGREADEELFDEARSSIWIYNLGDNQVGIGATAEDPQLAYQLVDSTINYYIQWQISDKRVDGEAAQSFLHDLVAFYEADLEAARTAMEQYLLEHPEPIRGDRSDLEQLEIARFQADIDFAAASRRSALDKEEDARLSLAQIESNARQNFLVMDAPQIPFESSTSLRSTAGSAALFVGAGVALSFIAVAGAAVLDRTFRFPIDVQNRLDLPVLTGVPDVSPRRKWYARFKRNKPEADSAHRPAQASPASQGLRLNLSATRFPKPGAGSNT